MLRLVGQEAIKNPLPRYKDEVYSTAGVDKQYFDFHEMKAYWHQQADNKVYPYDDCDIMLFA